MVVATAYNPLYSLRQKLVAYWDAEDASSVILSGSSVTMWRDKNAGFSAIQNGGSAQPTWSPTSFNGFPGVTFDGIDDTLLWTMPTLVPLPMFTKLCEVWIVVDQTSVGSDANGRTAVAYGNDIGVNGSRVFQVVFSGNVERIRGIVGTGVGSVTAQPAAVTYVGRHFTRMNVEAASITVISDNLGAATTSGVVNTPLPLRLRIGARESAAASQFWKGQIALVLITLPLTVNEAVRLSDYCQYRRRV